MTGIDFTIQTPNITATVNSEGLNIMYWEGLSTLEMLSTVRTNTSDNIVLQNLPTITAKCTIQGKYHHDFIHTPPRASDGKEWEQAHTKKFVMEFALFVNDSLHAIISGDGHFPEDIKREAFRLLLEFDKYLEEVKRYR